MGGDLIEDYDDFLFQVREQLGEITKQAQQEQNGPADAQVRVRRSQGTLNFLSGRSGQWRGHFLFLNDFPRVFIWLKTPYQDVATVQMILGSRWLIKKCCISSLSSTPLTQRLCMLTTVCIVWVDRTLTTSLSYLFSMFTSSLFVLFLNSNRIYFLFSFLAFQMKVATNLVHRSDSFCVSGRVVLLLLLLWPNSVCIQTCMRLPFVSVYTHCVCTIRFRASWARRQRICTGKWLRSSSFLKSLSR